MGRLPIPWSECLDRSAGGVAGSSAHEPALNASPVAIQYQDLFENSHLFPTPQDRRDFIRDVVVWANHRQMELSEEYLFLSTILVGGTARVDPAERDGPPILSSYFGHTVYTTNFDDALPQTLRVAGIPVTVVDHPLVQGRLSGEPDHPRVCHLHGSYLNYDLRNTTEEIRRPEEDRLSGVDLPGLFMRFRESLRSTGLIVVGYSGWNDRAMDVIRDALADPESLPLGLYWSCYPGTEALSDEARRLLLRHRGRAVLLEPGRPAVRLLDLLAHDLGTYGLESSHSIASRLTVFLPPLVPANHSGIGRPDTGDHEEVYPPESPTVRLGVCHAIGAIHAIRRALVDSRKEHFDQATSWLPGLVGLGDSLKETSPALAGLLGMLHSRFESILGQSTKELEAAERALLIYRAAGTDKGVATAALQTASAGYRRGLVSEESSIEAFWVEADSSARRHEAVHMLVSLQMMRALLRLEQGRVDEALAAEDEIARLLDPPQARVLSGVPDRHFALLRAQASRVKAILRLHCGLLTEALGAVDQSCDFFRSSTGFGQELATGQRLRGEILERCDRLEEAGLEYQSAHDRSRQLRDLRGQAHAALRSGSLALLQGNDGKAGEWFRESKVGFEQCGDDRNHTSAAVGQAWLLVRAGEFDPATCVLDDCELRLRGYRNDRWMMDLDLARAVLLASVGRTDESMRRCQQAQDKARERRDVFQQGRGARVLAECQRRAGDFEGAQRTLHEAIGRLKEQVPEEELLLRLMQEPALVVGRP
jgi:tetratricopeptide (TPR) repeat protein